MQIFSSKPFHFLLISSILFSFSVVTSIPINGKCTGAGYPENSTFWENLDLLLSSLTAKAASFSFYTDTVGEDPYRIYGLFQCGDVTAYECQSCLTYASNDIRPVCRTNFEGMLWYSTCFFRYSGFNFFGTMDSEGFGWSGRANLSRPDQASAMMKTLIEAALTSPTMSATDTLPDKTAYGLAPCTQDIRRRDCRKCLVEAMNGFNKCCAWEDFGRYMTSSCFVGNAAQRFFTGSKQHSFFLNKVCSNDEFYASSTSAANLNRLFSSLITTAPLSGFYNETIGEEASSRVYGLALCRGDVALDACRSCLNNARNDLTEMCPNMTRGVVWYENCLLRYSNYSFFGAVESDGFSIRHEYNDSDQKSLQLISTMLERVPIQPWMFAVQKLQIGESVSRYILAQCTRDLGEDDCRRCLVRSMGDLVQCCDGRKGWQYLTSSCFIRYDDHVFFNASILEAPADHTNEGERRNLKRVIIISVAAALGVTLLGSCICCCLWQRKRSSQEGKIFKGAFGCSIETN
ncbi:cysteine-rich receptor-like protein kinase 19 [Magnolia sinica]|uniref:cysteine-rich receptor-like protein kinase 19 n=1 Tax=Magnolia sinica TaxID=86752 RepID=UPI00265A18CB|nr:cysteine-rich receptor-like protein kinase 19 [Magnolia sinica]